MVARVEAEGGYREVAAPSDCSRLIAGGNHLAALDHADNVHDHGDAGLRLVHLSFGLRRLVVDAVADRRVVDTTGLANDLAGDVRGGVPEPAEDLGVLAGTLEETTTLVPQPDPQFMVRVDVG